VIFPILVSADQFLIGSLIGVAEVTHYAVPMNLIVRSQIFPMALGRTFFPKMRRPVTTGRIRFPLVFPGSCPKQSYVLVH
jgi:O-antigen/teichoic acid export membrane protein